LSKIENKLTPTARCGGSERDKIISGTKEGGRKAAATNKQRYGIDFYRVQGSAGGKKSKGGGFAQNRELAAIAGRRGGKASRRTKTEAD
jgi:general stress protein YciG